MLAPPTASPQEKTLSRSVDPLPKISYKPFSKKTTFICKFCGGKGCKHENWLTYPASAIKGLNSDWITPNILATQRPSSRIIKEYNIIQEFTDAGINAIFNLQEPGEHPFCGDGIHPQSGFSYFPEEFYEHGIYYFNFGWKDMTATSTDIVLKILKQMSFSLANGNKIAIHCHAGRGRTGLIIAAWLIYNNNMTAKEAIKLVRSKRKGAIQNKSQEEVLFRLDKEIRESRLIFHPSPKYKLEDFLFHQKKLLPLSTDSETRFVPNLVLVCLERLETLVNSGICTPVDVALAFYNPNESSYYKGEWTNYHEKALKSIKEKINSGNFELSDVDDPRLLAQSLLDYFDNFASPAIRTQFIDAIHEQIHQQEKLTKEMKDQFFNKLDKKEFLLVECFARFFSKLIYSGDASPEHFRKAILRVCISLVLERKKWDKLFLKRSLLQEHNGDDRVTHLNVFILKWVENFSTSFTEYYMVNKSPLKLHEKFLEAQIERVHKKRGSYLEKVLNKAGANSARDSPDYSGNDEVKMVSLFPQIPVGYTENQNQQINQESGGNMETGNKIPSKKLLSPVNFEKRGVRLISPKYKDTLNMSDCPDSHLGYDSSAEVKSEGGGRRDSVDSTTFKVRVHSAFKPAKFAEESENQDKIPSSTFSPSKNRTRTVAHPRVSLMRGEENPFVPSDSNSNGNSNINKNYDDFFSNNLLATEETPRQSVGAVADDSDGVSSDISDKDRFEDLWKEIEGLSEKKQGVMLQRLLKIQQAKSGSI